MTVIRHVDPQIGQTLRHYRKHKHLTQQELGEQLDQILAARGATSGSGMSKSFISRIEKAQFIPPQNKLEVMVELLAIPASEAQTLFALCGYTPPAPPDTEPSRIERLQQHVKAHPGDLLSLLDLVSLLNQERHFQAMHQCVLESLLQIEQSRPAASACFRALLLAKQQLGFALAERESEQETAYLELCGRFLEQARQTLKQERKLPAELSAGLQAEILRTALSQRYREVVKGLEHSSPAELKRDFAALQAQAEALRQELLLLPDSERLQHFKLYVQRERISIRLKEFESLERLSFQALLKATWPDQAQGDDYTTQNRELLAYLLAHPEQHSALSGLYRQHGGMLQFSQDPLNMSTYADLSRELLDFLDTYQALLRHGQGPEQLPMTGIFNTYLLYLALLSRFEAFSHQGEYLLKSLYLLCKHQHLANWHYVCSCFYAYRYLFHQNPSDLDQSLAAWKFWCQVPPEDSTRYHPHRFQALLQEPVLWLGYLHGLGAKGEKSANAHWLTHTLSHFLQFNA